MTTPAEHPWGRVDDEGNVHLRTADGERIIGQWAAGSDPTEALAFYERRFGALETEVELLEKRLESGALSPADAVKALDKARENISGASALGDLASLEVRLTALAPQIEKAREAKKAAREAEQAKAEERKTAIVAEAEKISAGTEYRKGSDRLSALLDEWKALPRLSRSADDALWKRFSAARTSFMRARKTFFAEQDGQRAEAKKIKEKLIVEAEALSASTDFGATTSAYRDLMSRWKAAGSAPRNVEDKLWKRFRAAQDAFFGARDEANAALDKEFEVNAEVKEKILVEAEALLPINDADAVRKTWNDIADRWEAAGKVPRARISELEGRLRKVEEAVRAAGDRKWQRTDPEKSARADDMIGKLERAITETEESLAQAETAGDKRKVKDLTAKLESNRAFLDMALKAQADFS